jgi:16S rRNA C1402 (ribose-2'-O) methylase RsmI
MFAWRTAFVPALVNSGLPNDRFIFEGFLPEKKGAKPDIWNLPRKPELLFSMFLPQIEKHWPNS